MLRDRILDGAYAHIVLFPSPEVTNGENIIVSISAALALVAHKATIPFTIIGGAAAHQNFWSWKPMVILERITSVFQGSFPLCSFGVSTDLRMTLWTTSELVRSKFADLECTHSSHASSDTLSRLPDAASTALAQAIASTAVTDSVPEFTTKIDGLHPIFAARYDTRLQPAYTDDPYRDMNPPSTPC